MPATTHTLRRARQRRSVDTPDRLQLTTMDSGGAPEGSPLAAAQPVRDGSTRRDARDAGTRRRTIRRRSTQCRRRASHARQGARRNVSYRVAVQSRCVSRARQRFSRGSQLDARRDVTLTLTDRPERARRRPPRSDLPPLEPRAVAQRGQKRKKRRRGKRPRLPRKRPWLPRKRPWLARKRPWLARNWRSTRVSS